MAGLAVYARAVNPKGPESAVGGQVNGAVSIGGCAVAPGDLVIGDCDGLVALPPALLADLIDAASGRARLAAGDAITAIFGLP
jgi:regulator of RNase E activity RraA